jgi:hypothetical protein
VDNRKNINFTTEPPMPEILLDDAFISDFDVSGDIIIYSEWRSNNIFILNIKNRKIEILTTFEKDLFISSIVFMKNEGLKFLFVVLSNGKMLFYKLKSK